MEKGSKSRYISLIIVTIIIVAAIVILQNPFSKSAVIDVDVATGNGVGDLAPDFKLMTPKNEEIQLSSFRGKPVIVNFWATWCPPCEEEFPMFEEEFKKNRVQILAVNLQENGDKAQDWVDERGFTIPVLLDPNADVKNIYGVFTQPVTYFLDSNGIIQAKKFGQILESEFQENLDKVL